MSTEKISKTCILYDSNIIVIYIFNIVNPKSLFLVMTNELILNLNFMYSSLLINVVKVELLHQDLKTS